MQLQKQNSKIVSRIVTDKNGQEFLAWFLVTQVSGRFFAKLIRLEKIENDTLRQDKKFFLDGIICPSCFEVNKNFGDSIQSPYVKSDFFLSSQMTRAPSQV